MSEENFLRKLWKGTVDSIKDSKFKIINSLIIIVSIGCVGQTIITFLEFIIDSITNEKWKTNIKSIIDIWNICNKIIPSKIWWYIIVFFLLIVRGVLWYIKRCYKILPNDKQQIYILAQETFKNSDLTISKEKQNNTELIIEEDFDVVQEFENLNYENNEFKRNVQKIIERQDATIKKFILNKVNGKEYGYMGISHTPLILRAGMKMTDGNILRLFHKKRGNNFYTELSNDDVYPQLRVEKKVNNPDSKELIVAIATSFPIEDSQLSALKSIDRNILKFKSDELDVDIILSKNQVDNYINFILNTVREFVRENDIEKIHLVIASSVAFTFALGQRLTTSYDKEIVIYNYEARSDKKYPWGIKLFEDSYNCVEFT